jgi:lipopolysaccharide export system protein LptC
MRQWSSAVLPLSILLILLALTSWLRYATEFPEARSDGKNRHDPDYIVTDAKGRKLDPSGRLLYTLVADELRTTIRRIFWGRPWCTCIRRGRR